MKGSVSSNLIPYTLKFTLNIREFLKQMLNISLPFNIRFNVHKSQNHTAATLDIKQSFVCVH